MTQATTSNASGPVVPVILAGGSGSRLWPLSRELFPKQFHALFGNGSLLQNTLRRAAGAATAAPVIVCNEEHRFMVAEQCRQADVAWQRILLEPEGRNTAPAIALAALEACRAHGDGILLVLPSDHLIDDAGEGALVTFGVAPTAPETGYGYIQAPGARAGDGAVPVRSFVEKPDAATAAGYLACGDYFWNSCMFVFGAKAYLAELGRWQPEVLARVEAAFAAGTEDLDFFRPGGAFLESPSISVDYAVMERTRAAMVVPVAFGWNDVGSWSAIWQASPRDCDGNCFTGDVLGVDSRNSYVLAQSRLVGAIGVDNLIVVETPDAVLVADKNRVQDVKQLVEQLRAGGRSEHLFHREVFRPWGSYEGVQQGERYQVKRIQVKPGQRLSLQMHHHRSEHWIVVRGTAEVTRGDEIFTLTENQSTYIPLGVTHRLANPGKLELELIEVQVGAYLGEDDIVRFEDQYGR
jgi:mannose-1-phosphate guanylyltransferase/mannose-6-phosphate isomerase